jgi:hypothetical protein
MEWKWTKGEPYERSRRARQTTTRENEALENFNKDIETTAYASSLNYDENTWDILNQSAANNGFKVSNKREDLDFKISDRALMQQCGFNPFLNSENYVEDISIRDKFLKPINTTTDRVKATSTD